MSTANGSDDCVVFKVSRKSLIRDTKRDLLFCLNSVQRSLTLNTLKNLFKEETDNNLSEIATALGYSSISIMLDSEEFADVVEHHFNNSIMERVYKSRSNDEVVTPESSGLSSETAMVNDLTRASTADQVNFSSIDFNDKRMLQGKERILRVIAKLGGERNNVVLPEVQRLYYAEYNVLLDKAELRRYFAKSHIKQILDEYMKEELEVSIDPYRSGSFYIRMKIPFTDFVQQIKAILEENSEHSVPLNGSISSEALDSPNYLSNVCHENDTTNSYFLSLNFNNSVDNNSSKSSKFLLNKSVNVKRAYTMSNLDGVNRESMAPHVKMDNAPSIQARTAAPSAMTEHNLLLNDEINWSAEIDLCQKSLLNLNMDNFKESNSTTVQKLSTEDFLLSYEDAKLFDRNNYHVPANDGVAKESVNVSVTTATQPGGRPLGNVEELNEILAVNSSSCTQFYQQNNIVSQNSRKSSNSLRVASHYDEKPIVKYTKRCEGTFTDDECSTEDELVESNREIKRLENTVEEFPKLTENNGSAKIDMGKADVDQNVVDDLDARPSVNRTNFEPRGCHAEKYLRQALINQEENQARRSAYRIAHLQQFHPNTPVKKAFKIASAEKTKGSDAQTDEPIKTTTQRTRKQENSVQTFYGVMSTNGGLNEKRDYIDEDFEIDLPKRVQRPGSQVNTNGHAKWSNVANLLLSYGDESGEDESSAKLYALATTISLIIMIRKPSITLTGLESALLVIYGKKLEPNKDFPEERLEDFINKYCRNVFAINVPSNVLYVWKAQGDSDFRSMITKVGKFCAEKGPIF